MLQQRELLQAGQAPAEGLACPRRNPARLCGCLQERRVCGPGNRRGQQATERPSSVLLRPDPQPGPDAVERLEACEHGGV